MRRDLPSGTVTFLFTDVEGSTKLLHELGADEYAQALAEHRRILREAFSAHGGVEVDTQGDAFFVAFPTAPGALEAAAEALEGLAPGPIRVRMGIHTGTPLLGEEGYVGVDVHRAARIAARGHGGQALISKETRELAHVDVTDLGEHRLKDFEGPAWIFQLGSERFPPLKTISNTNLPRPASSFVGREREVKEVLALLQDGARLLTLTGPGGSGKTRLAIEAAAELVPKFTAGVFWVSLAELRDPALVTETIGQTLGAKDALAEHIQERELLLLLDNLEQLVEAAPELASLVETCPNLKLLVTSRELLRVRGEVEYPVLPLADPEAVELFCARARTQRDETVHELCRALDNLPLALELAAARASVVSPKQILDRLSQRLDLLKGGRDADPRQATLRATMEWSHDLLSKEEKATFGRLAVFSGAWTLEAAEEVTEADLNTLQALVDKSLLRHTDSRFWMLETIREFADERLEESGAAAALRRRHAAFFLAVAESAGFTHEGRAEERYDLVLAERANLRAALEWSLDADPELGLRLAVALEYFWLANSPFEGRRWLGELLERASEIPEELRARALKSYGGVIWIVGDWAEGLRYYERAHALYRRLGDERGIGLLLPRLAAEAQRTGDLVKARTLCEESLALHRRGGFKKGEATALGILGYVEYREGRYEEALELSDRSASLAEEVGMRWWQVGALQHAAECALRLSRPDEARPRARKGLSLSHPVGARQHTVFGLGLLAWTAAESGEAELAGRLWGAIEAEVERGRVGQWEDEREDYWQHVLAVSGPEFERGLAEGKTLPLDEAVALALEAD